MKIKIINKLTLSHKGLSIYPNNPKELQPVFLRQGDLDGACGHYAASMLAIVLGIHDRTGIEDLWNLYDNPIDKRTNFGKWASENINSVFEGTDYEQIRGLFNSIQGRYSHRNYTSEILSSDSVRNIGSTHTTGRGFLKKVRLQCDKELPSLINIDWKGGGAHWVLAIGYQAREERNMTENFESILVLDPGAPFDPTAAWNGVISKLYGKNGPRPYQYWSSARGPVDCSIDGGIVVNSRDSGDGE